VRATVNIHGRVANQGNLCSRATHRHGDSGPCPTVSGSRFASSLELHSARIERFRIDKAATRQQQLWLMRVQAHLHSQCQTRVQAQVLLKYFPSDAASRWNRNAETASDPVRLRGALLLARLRLFSVTRPEPID
jgi:hypothetical protein